MNRAVVLFWIVVCSVSRTDYVSSNGKMISNNKLAEVRNEILVAILKQDGAVVMS
jgi:hypothetical protein